MTLLTRTPRLIRGALISYDVANLSSNVIIFQYNPSEVSRTLGVQMSGDDSNNRVEALRLKGPPTETLSFKIEIDATDQLETANPVAVNMGIYPQLSALEILIYPKTATVMRNTALYAAGTLEILPADAPLILLVWGTSRVVPVRISDFTINEEAYDVNLNPIRAEVSLGLRTLTYDDLPTSHPGYYTFLSYQMVKETMATLNNFNNAHAIDPRAYIKSM